MLPPVVTVPADALAGVPSGAAVPLPDDARHHLRTVLRIRPGEVVEVVDGVGTRAPATVADGEVLVLSAPARREPRPQPRLEVIHALPRGRKLDEVVRALTELGVDRISPVHSDRSPVQLQGAKAAKAAQRWRAVARAAAEQSRRAWHCEIDEPAVLSEVLAAAVPATRLLVAHVGAEAGLASALASTRQGQVQRWVLGIGPESGWSEDEVAAFVASGAQPVHLGSTVLRTEHAALVAAAVLSAAVGRMG